MRITGIMIILTFLGSNLGCSTDSRPVADKELAKQDQHGGDPLSMMFTEARFDVTAALRKVTSMWLSRNTVWPTSGRQHSPSGAR